MNVFLGHITSCIFWLAATPYEVAHLKPTKTRPSSATAATARQARAVLEHTRFQDGPLGLCVAANATSHHTSGAAVVRSDNYPAKAFLQYTRDVFIASPELSFIQMASVLSFDELVLYGNFLCATFYQDNFAIETLPHRDPVTTPSLLEVAAKTPRIVGRKQALRAIKYITPNCASPMECLIALWFSLAQMDGGYGISKVQSNYVIPLPEHLQRYTGKTFLVADYCWPDRKVVVEYDSDQIHANPHAIAQDTIRRNALQELGYTVIGITKAQAFDESKMDHTASEIMRALGLRKRPRSSLYDIKKLEMRQRSIKWALTPPDKLFENSEK